MRSLVVCTLLLTGFAGCNEPTLDCDDVIGRVPVPGEPALFWGLEPENQAHTMAWVLGESIEGEARQLGPGVWEYPLSQGELIVADDPVPPTVHAVLRHAWTADDASEAEDDLQGITSILAPGTTFRILGDARADGMLAVQLAGGIATDGGLKLTINSDSAGMVQKVTATPWGRVPTSMLSVSELLDAARDHADCAAHIDAAENLLLREPLRWNEGFLEARLTLDVELECGMRGASVVLDAGSGAMLSAWPVSCPE